MGGGAGTSLAVELRNLEERARTAVELARAGGEREILGRMVRGSYLCVLPRDVRILTVCQQKVFRHF